MTNRLYAIYRLSNTDWKSGYVKGLTRDLCNITTPDDFYKLEEKFKALGEDLEGDAFPWIYFKERVEASGLD